MMQTLPSPAPTCAALRHLRVRASTTADGPSLSAIYNDGVGTARGTSTPSRTSLRLHLSVEGATEWVLRHQQALRPLWLASVDQTPVAWVSFIGFSERPGCDAACELGVQVRHGWRGQGIGRDLLARAVAVAPRLGFERLMAFIAEDNAASLALFRGHGFEPWGRLPGVVRVMGTSHDVLILGLSLNAAAPRGA